MVDRLSSARRSWNMGRIGGKNTRPEVLVRSIVHTMGYRFTVNGPLNSKLPGRPDMVLPKYRTAIFVHGCFWHRHTGCTDSTTPRTRTAWWQEKFKGNVSRDRAAQAALKHLGWSVIIVWECQTTSAMRVDALRTEIAQQLGRRTPAERCTIA
jgi:DNA mismatch endonuclease (patch repair protein)